MIITLRYSVQQHSAESLDKENNAHKLLSCIILRYSYLTLKFRKSQF